MKSITRVSVGIIALTAFSFPAAAANADPAWCGEVITVPGARVTLTDNLYCDGTALTVAADNVTIDLAGFTIKGGGTDPRSHLGDDPRYGSWTVGVQISGAAHTRITGGRIYGFDAGIVAGPATGVVVDHMVITTQTRWGIWAHNTEGVAVADSTFSGPWTLGDKVDYGEGRYEATGIDLQDTGVVSIASSTITGLRGNGVFTYHVNALTVSGSHIIDNAGDGLQLWATGGTFALRDSVIDGNANGVQFDHTTGTSDVSIDGVSASENRENGIYITDLQRATVTKVNASGNGGNGIWLSSGIDPIGFGPLPFRATVSGSTANSNGQGGIAFELAGTWTLSNNTASGNHAEGFYGAGGRITSSGNVAQGNGTNGFLWDTGLTGTSTADIASASQSAGIRVKIGADHAMSITDASASSGRSYGLLVNSGTASVVRGTFAKNTLDGIRVASGGTGYVSYAGAAKNSGNGIAFVAGSSGYGYRLAASSNGRYGLCTDSAAAYRNYPPHVLLFNGAGATGHICDGFLFPVWLP